MAEEHGAGRISVRGWLEVLLSQVVHQRFVLAELCDLRGTIECDHVQQIHRQHAEHLVQVLRQAVGRDDDVAVVALLRLHAADGAAVGVLQLIVPGDISAFPAREVIRMDEQALGLLVSEVGVDRPLGGRDGTNGKGGDRTDLVSPVGQLPDGKPAAGCLLRRERKNRLLRDVECRLVDGHRYGRGQCRSQDVLNHSGPPWFMSDSCRDGDI